MKKRKHQDYLPPSQHLPPPLSGQVQKTLSSLRGLWGPRDGGRAHLFSPRLAKSGSTASLGCKYGEGGTQTLLLPREKRYWPPSEHLPNNRTECKPHCRSERERTVSLLSHPHSGPEERGSLKGCGVKPDLPSALGVSGMAEGGAGGRAGNANYAERGFTCSSDPPPRDWAKAAALARAGAGEAPAGGVQYRERWGRPGAAAGRGRVRGGPAQRSDGM